MTLTSAQHDSFKLGKLSILRQKSSEVALCICNMNQRLSTVDWEWQLQCWASSDSNIGVSTRQHTLRQHTYSGETRGLVAGSLVPLSGASWKMLHCHKRHRCSCVMGQARASVIYGTCFRSICHMSHMLLKPHMLLSVIWDTGASGMSHMLWKSQAQNTPILVVVQVNSHLKKLVWSARIGRIVPI